MDVRELLARESIRDLVTRYNSNGDSGRFAAVLELFAADAVMQLGDRVCVGRDEILTIFTDTRARVRGESAPGYVRHFTATFQIDLVDDEHATGRCSYAVLSPTGLDHWGLYLDEYRVVDGAWRFASRRVTVDGVAATSILSDRSA